MRFTRFFSDSACATTVRTKARLSGAKCRMRNPPYSCESTAIEWTMSSNLGTCSGSRRSNNNCTTFQTFDGRPTSQANTSDNALSSA